MTVVPSQPHGVLIGLHTTVMQGDGGFLRGIDKPYSGYIYRQLLTVRTGLDEDRRALPTLGIDTPRAV